MSEDHSIKLTDGDKVVEMPIAANGIVHEIVMNTDVPFTKTSDAAYTNSDAPYGDLDTKDIEW